MVDVPRGFALLVSVFSVTGCLWIVCSRCCLLKFLTPTDSAFGLSVLCTGFWRYASIPPRFNTLLYQ
ncbi:hypothetical protein DENSPDRAFT_839473 [Dentipellis sp. KUC8613]|nr:hypothetical protein DENSPDRAFT_839473 [Dentipellis sp. KUC8613]